ncbi:hypothetical protein ACTFIR_010074 [Dictyostelium discoideum]
MIAITRLEAVQCINNALGTKYTIFEDDLQKDYFKIKEGEKKLTITFYHSTDNIQIQGCPDKERTQIKNLLIKLNNEKNYKNMENSFSAATNLDAKIEDKKDADGANTTQQAPKNLKAFVVNGNNEIQEKYSKVLEDMNISIVLLESKNGKTDIKNFEKTIDGCDFGLLYVTYDLESPNLEYEEQYYPRLNLIFEMGLLYSLKGKNNTIYVDLVPDGNKLHDFIGDIEELICVSNVNDFKIKLTELVEQHQGL